MAFGIQISTIFIARILENAVQKGQLLVVKRGGQYQWRLGVGSVKVQWEELPTQTRLCHAGPRPL